MQEDDYDIQADYYDSLVESVSAVLDSIVDGRLQDYLGLSPIHRFAAIVNWGSLNKDFNSSVQGSGKCVTHIFNEMALFRFTVQEYYGQPYLWCSGYLCMLNLFDMQVYTVEDVDSFESFESQFTGVTPLVDASKLASLILPIEGCDPQDYAPLAEYRHSDPLADLSPFTRFAAREPSPESDLSVMGADYRSRLISYIAVRGFPAVTEENFIAGDLGAEKTAGADKALDGTIWSAVSPFIAPLTCRSSYPVDVLDIGAGDGTRSALLEGALHSISVRSIDPSLCHGTFKKHYASTDHRLLLPSKRDVVIMNMVLHHAQRIDRVFVQSIADSLKDGGFLVVRDHNWDGSREQEAYFDSLHHAHSCMGSSHCGSGPTRYFSGESIIRIFSRSGLIYCPAVDPIEGGLHSAGGASRACVLVFVKATPLTYIEHLRSLSFGVWFLHSLTSGETDVAQLEDRLGLTLGTMAAYAHNVTPACRPINGKFTFNPFSSNSVGYMLCKAFQDRREERQAQSAVRVKNYVHSRETKQCPRKDGPYARVHDFSALLQELSDPSVLVAPSRQLIEEEEDDAILLQKDNLTKKEMTILMAEEQRLQKIARDTGVHRVTDDDHYSVSIEDFDEEQDPCLMTAEFTPRRSPRETIKIMVNRLPKKFAYMVLMPGELPAGIPELANDLLKEYVYSASAGPSLSAVFWMGVVLLRCVRKMPLSRNQMRNQLTDLGWCFDKTTTNAILYGLYDIGWLLEPQGPGPWWTFSCPRARYQRLKIDIAAAKERKAKKQGKK